MPCGCSGECGCTILDDGATTSVVNVGSTFTVSAIQFINNIADSNCIDLAVAGGVLGASLIVAAPVGSVVSLSCGAGGLLATITIDPDAGLEDTGFGIGVKIDPASTAPITLSADGLRVDCCAAGGAGSLTIADTPTIDLDNALNVLSADVVLDSNGGLEVTGSGVAVNTDPASPIPLSLGAAGLSAGPMDSVSTSIWRQGALVTVTGTTSLVFAENGAVATFNSAAGYRGITWLDPADYVTSGGTCEARVVLDYATVTSPSVAIGCSLFPVTSINAGTLTLGAVLTTGQTVGNAGANELGAVVTPWVTIGAASFLVATFEWDAISGAANTYGDMRIEVRQQ